MFSKHRKSREPDRKEPDRKEPDNKKFRHEYKFICSVQDALLIESRIRKIMAVDPNVGSDGFYNIRSVYFDDYNNTCLYANEAGTDPRAKYRIRIYNNSDRIIRLEKKIKQKGMTRKLSAPLTREQCDCLIAGRLLPMDQISMEGYPELLSQFLLLQAARKMTPKVIVDYDRVPYVYRDGNVRITLDKNIAGSGSFDRLFNRELPKRPVLPVGKCLVEVKYDEFLPGFLKQHLETGRLTPVTFSKYYLCSMYGQRYGIIKR